MSWAKWGAATVIAPPQERADGPLLVADRFCPRCDGVTAWDNSGTDGSLIVACISCGLTTDGVLSDDEHDRLLAYDERPIPMRRRRWSLV